jgi:GrpB-like predicted nucleotidyltransferase (UPF0157 family)
MADQSIELAAYDPTWPVRFAGQQTRLAALLKPWLAGEIEHVGSTSVPGLRSKPIVDILAPVVSLAASRAAIPVLEKDGWLFWLDDPNENYRLWFLRPSPSARTHHLQVIQHDHPSLRALIAFRDALRQDPPLRKAYSSLKEDLARKHQSDRNAYSNAKTEFVQSVLEAAGVGLSSRTPV